LKRIDNVDIKHNANPLAMNIILTYDMKIRRVMGRYVFAHAKHET
jgi:hypothetical protein